jgi:hypothetical protein
MLGGPKDRNIQQREFLSEIKTRISVVREKCRLGKVLLFRVNYNMKCNRSILAPNSKYYFEWVPKA